MLTKVLFFVSASILIILFILRSSVFLFCFALNVLMIPYSLFTSSAVSALIFVSFFNVLIIPISSSIFIFYFKSAEFIRQIRIIISFIVITDFFVFSLGHLGVLYIFFQVLYIFSSGDVTIIVRPLFSFVYDLFNAL